MQILQEMMSCEDLKPIVLNQAKAEIKDQTLCSKKAKRLLNWSPQYSLEQGLLETIDWYKSYLEKGQACHLENAAFAEMR